MRIRFIPYITLGLLMILTPVIISCKSPATAPVIVAAQIDTALIFNNNCAVCHGPNRLGTANGPNITQAALVLRTEADLILKISTHQTGIALTAPEVAALATFLKFTP